MKALLMYVCASTAALALECVESPSSFYGVPKPTGEAFSDWPKLEESELFDSTFAINGMRFCLSKDKQI